MHEEVHLAVLMRISSTLRLSLPRRAAAALAGVFLMAGLDGAGAQSAQGAKRASTMDTRWTPWLGCWQSDTTANAELSCVVPAGPSSYGVDVLSVVRGKVVARRRLEADGRTREMREDGCEGTRTGQWSQHGQRVYLHSDYTCTAGVKGSSSSLIAMIGNGEWLEVEHVRAGGGSIEHINHWRDAGLPAGLPAEVTSAIAGRQLALTTARAAAAAPITVDDVLEALHSVDGTTVRDWIAESGERFSLNADQVNTLVRADVPQSVLQAMMGWNGQAAGVDTSMRNADVYLSTHAGSYMYGAPVPSAPVEMQPPAEYCTTYGCYPTTPYSTYNGYTDYGYSPYGYGYPAYPYGYYPPIVTTQGGNRGRGHGGGRGFPQRHEPLVGVHPTMPRPGGQRPVAHQPIGYVQRGTTGRRP